MNSSLAARARALSRALAARLAYAPWRREAAALSAAATLAACVNDGSGDKSPDPTVPTSPVSGPPPADVTGAWTGTAGVGANRLNVRIVFKEAAGSLTGDVFVGQPTRPDYSPYGTLSGIRAGATAQLSLTFGASLEGEFRQEQFTGSLTFPPRGGEPEVRAELRLQR